MHAAALGVFIVVMAVAPLCGTTGLECIKCKIESADTCKQLGTWCWANRFDYATRRNQRIYITNGIKPTNVANITVRVHTANLAFDNCDGGSPFVLDN